jgi:C-terminal processing protease CtpA/Prc
MDNPERNSYVTNLQRGVAILFLLLWVPLLYPQEAPITSFQRAYIGVMLNEVKDDVKHYYYDPKYHGVDLDARFKEAAEYLKTASTYNQAIGIVEYSLKALNDSHTHLFPPNRPVKIVYSYEYQMIGNNCYATAIEPGGESEKSGLKVGDRLLSMNGIAFERETFWEINYIFRALRPQSVDQVVIQSPDGLPRTLNIAPKITPEPHHLFLGEAYWDSVREAQTRRKRLAPHSHALGDAAIIWKIPAFNQDERMVDDIMKQTSRFPALILDLRQNGGGAEVMLLRLLGSLFEHDVKVADRVLRKGTEPVIAKTHGGNPYKGKVIVLVDQRSASASEVFARVMQLNNRGTVVGDQTAGSVMEARIYAHPFGRSTTEFFATEISQADLKMADGVSLERVGVTPDEKLLPSAEDLAKGRDPVLAHAAKLAGAELSPEDAAKLFPIEWAKD